MNKIQDILNAMARLYDEDIADGHKENAFIVMVGTNGEQLAWLGINEVGPEQKIQADIAGIAEMINFVMKCRGPERSIAYTKMLDVKQITDDAMSAILDAAAKVQAAETIISSLVVEKDGPELKIVKH
jgi:hypothetical protein